MKTCSVEGCGLQSKARTFCDLHYKRYMKRGTTAAPIPAPAFCTVEDCERPNFGQGFCMSHYRKMRRSGELHRVRNYPANIGCKFPGCERRHDAHGHCSAHEKLRRAGKPLRPIGPPIRKGVSNPLAQGPNNPKWKGDEVGYFGAHNRVRRERGAPTTCEECGAEAKHWAHIHGTKMADPQNFRSLCVSCHAKYDAPTKIKNGRHPNSKLTVGQVQEVLSSDESGRSIARRLGVWSATIYNIRNGKTWKHLHANKNEEN